VPASIRERVRDVIAANANLPVAIAELDDGADLFLSGMSSHASVTVMVALEDEFDVEFPDSMLDRSVFESIDALTRAITEISTSDLDAVSPGE
jgi:acyl carrier protein